MNVDSCTLAGDKGTGEPSGSSSGITGLLARIPTPARAASTAMASVVVSDVSYSKSVLAQQTRRCVYAAVAGCLATAEEEALAGAIRYASDASAAAAEVKAVEVHKQASLLDCESTSWKVVNRPICNVRAAPDRKARIVIQKKYGATVWGFEVNGWVQLDGYGEEGFMMISNAEQGTLLRRTDEVRCVQPIEDSGPCLPLLECPWAEHLAQFVSTRELAMVAGSARAARERLTVELSESDDGSRRLLLAPLVELKVETAEEELARVSLAHARVLRIWSRLSFEAASAAVVRGGPVSIRCLEKLFLKGCKLYPPDVQTLFAPIMSSASRLTTLNLEKNQLQDAAIEAIATSGLLEAAPCLESLNVRFNRIGDDGAIALAESPGVAKLKWMNLKMNSITDKGAMALAKMLNDNRSMTLINLRKQFPGLTDKSAFAFADTLRSNSVIEQVRLRRNKISDVGAAALAGAVAARFGDCLVPPAERLELDLEDNRIKAAGALALLRAVAVVPRPLRLELLLCGNDVSRGSLTTAALEAPSKEDNQLNPFDDRLKFESKGEGEL